MSVKQRQQDSRKGCRGETVPQPGEEEVASPQASLGSQGQSMACQGQFSPGLARGPEKMLQNF